MPTPEDQEIATPDVDWQLESPDNKLADLSEAESKAENAPPFICDCYDFHRSACDGLPFYKEQEGKRYCVLHYPDKEKASDFRPVFEEKKAKGDFDFGGVWFPEAVDFQGFEFQKVANFSGAKFDAEADFCVAKFGAEANFRGAKFGAEALFYKTEFGAETYFRDAKFGAVAFFNGAKFDAGAEFSGAVFGAKAYFRDAKFDAGAYFNDATFGAVAFFNDATFGPGASFSRAKFKEGAEANFDLAKFGAEAYFSEAEFGADVNFRQATFGATADFSGAKFALKTDYRSAIFGATAGFYKATFVATADFSGATFGAEAYFNEAIFGAQANFSYSIFGAEANFSAATFKDSVNFKNNIFRKAARLIFQPSYLKKPNLVHFHTVTLQPHWVITLHVRDFQFTMVEWKSRFFLKGREVKAALKALEMNYVEEPYRLLAATCRQFVEQTDKDSRHEEASLFRFMAMEAQRLESWRGWAVWKLRWWYWLVSGYGEQSGKAALVLLSIWLGFALLYTQVGFEVKKPEQSKIILEIKKPQNQETLPEIIVIPNNEIATSPESSVPPIVEPGNPLTLPQALNHSINVMALQKPEPKPQTIIAKSLVSLETILGPLQAALLALAIRRKFMK